MNRTSKHAQDSSLLTAYLLGELDDASQAEIEARAATDLEFAELRDRLSATIDLVRTTLGDAEAVSRLSPTHRDALRIVASRRNRTTFHPLRFAVAATLLIGFGCVLYRLRPASIDATLATQERLVARVADDLERMRVDSLRSELAAIASGDDTRADSAPTPTALGLGSQALIGYDADGKTAAYKTQKDGEQVELDGYAQLRPNVLALFATSPGKSADLDLLGRPAAPGSAGSNPSQQRYRSSDGANSLGEIGATSVSPAIPSLSQLELEKVTDSLTPQSNGTALSTFVPVVPNLNPSTPLPDDVLISGRRGAIGIVEHKPVPFDNQVAFFVDGTKLPAGNHVSLSNFELVTSNRVASVAAIQRSCERHPGERPRDMYFRFFQDNAFERASEQPLSTFAADVDTASYALARKYLEAGYLPEKAQVRTEEFLNWFKPDVAAPTDTALAVSVDLGKSPFGGEDSNRRMLRVILRSRDVAKDRRPQQRLMLVIDTSGSMAEQSRLELVKHQLRLLTAKLEDGDELGLVRFADDASLVLPMTKVSDRVAIERAIYTLLPEGSTNACAGLRLGCATLVERLDREATNHVVLFSDGVANTGTTDADAILAEIAELRKKNLYLSTIGVGMNNHNDALLERLADAGDGSCAYVDSEEEGKRAIVDRFSGAFIPVARDVKVQVEFDAAQVERYRLIGYENRPIADADFTNDAVDAGEIGANTQVTALYEIEPAARYGELERPFAKANVRWLPPLGHGEGVSGNGAFVSADQEAATFDAMAPGFRRACLVAQFAEFLRRSSHAENDSFDRLLALSHDLARTLSDPEFDQFVALVERSRDLIVSTLTNADPLRRAIDALRRNAVLRAEIEDAAKGEANEILKQIEQENHRLEELLKKLLGEAR